MTDTTTAIEERVEKMLQGLTDDKIKASGTAELASAVKDLLMGRQLLKDPLR